MALRQQQPYELYGCRQTWLGSLRIVEVVRCRMCESYSVVFEFPSVDPSP